MTDSCSVVVDDVDDTCSCDSLYLSIIDTPVEELPPSTILAVSPPTTSSVPEPDSQSLKDQRSHERDRQRLKKPEDIRKAKRCVRCRMCKPEKWAGNAGRPKQGSRVLRASVLEAEREGDAGLGDSVDLTEDGHGTCVPPFKTVMLSELVKPPRKGSDKQFEMVGRPRQVLVLDEFTEVGTTYDLDDWEHIEFETKNRKAMLKAPKAPSYARVVASRA